MNDDIGAGITAELDRVSALIDLRRLADARRRLHAILSQAPDSARAWRSLAIVQIEQGAYDEGLRSAEQAARLDPTDAATQRLASIALEALGRKPEAAKRAHEAVRLAPHWWATHTQLAQVLALGRFSHRRAVLAGRQAVQLAPNEPGAHRGLGEVYLRVDRRRSAEASLRRALALDPNDLTSREALARFDASAPWSSVGLVRAAEGFASVLAANPSDRNQLENLRLTLSMYLNVISGCVVLTALVMNALFLGDDTGFARSLPPLTLLTPALISVKFVPRFSPAVRRELARLARGRRATVQIALTGASALAVLVAAPVPASARTAALFTSIALGFLTGCVAFVARGEPDKAPSRLPRPLGTTLRVTGIVVTGLIASLFVSDLRGPDAAGAALFLSLCGMAILVEANALVLHLRRRPVPGST